MASFKIGINMAGAISAGAYTAGVLDFLTQALDEWYAAKKSGQAVPRHDISIDVFAGASAGGMCAAISSVMLHQDFEHIDIDNVNKQGTTNIFYESWVNKIDISELLRNDDLKSGAPVVSLLNSNIIETIAAFALKPAGAPAPRDYVSPNLTLFLSLTNLRGVPYSLNAAAPGSVEETTFFYGDRIHFQTTMGGTVSAPAGRSVRTLDVTKPGKDGGWDVLQTAAMATGAFPIFLAPRILDRKLEEYVPPLWESVASAVEGTPPPVAPNIPKEAAGKPYTTLNVDGGVTNNDPFNYCHDFLCSLEPKLAKADPAHPEKAPGKDPVTVDRAVINVAPFPTTDAFDPNYDAQKAASVFLAIPKLFAALLSQARFFGESLQEVMKGATFDRYVIAPSDDVLVEEYKKRNQSPPPALQCATLGAFGGFFERKFRAHDYVLGRRNCQKFLKDYFILPANNPIIQSGLSALDAAQRQEVINKFAHSAPGTYSQPGADIHASGGTLPDAQTFTPEEKASLKAQGFQEGKMWMPLIPLYGKAVPEARHPAREKLSSKDLDRIVGQIHDRMLKLFNVLVSQVRGGLRWFLLPGPFFITFFAKDKIKKALVEELGDSYQG